jgi:hypothetical protein
MKMDILPLLLSCQAQAQTQEQQQATLVSNHNDQQPQEGTAHPSPIHLATPIHEGARVKSNLFSNLTALRRDAMPRASSVNSVLGFNEGTPTGATPPDRPTALNSSKYPATLHNGLPTEDQYEAVHGASIFSLLHRVAPGSKGHFWFLQVGVKYLDDQDSRMTMLLGLSSLMDILPGAINGFAMHPLNESSALPSLTNNQPKDSFPGSAVLAFKYFMVKNKSNLPANHQLVGPPLQPSPHRHNDEEEYKPPTSLWGVIQVTGNGNIKEACKSLVWDMVDTCLQIRLKEHQLADSSAQVLLMNILPVLNRSGVEGEILWHLAEIEKGLLKKGCLPTEYIGVPLPEFKVSWRQNKQGKGKNKAEKDLILHKLAAFQENGCLVCTVEACEGSWP